MHTAFFFHNAHLWNELRNVLLVTVLLIVHLVFMSPYVVRVKVDQIVQVQILDGFVWDRFTLTRVTSVRVTAVRDSYSYPICIRHGPENEWCAPAWLYLPSYPACNP